MFWIIYGLLIGPIEFLIVRLFTEKLDFIDFTYEVPDYSEKVEQIMKGIKNATAKN